MKQLIYIKVMYRYKKSIILSLIIIWTSLNYMLLGPALSRYRTLESNGFITDNVFITSRTDLLYDFTTFEEIVNYADANYDSFIIAAKFDRKNIGIFTKNYPWSPPIISPTSNITLTLNAKNESIKIVPGFSNGVLNLSQINFTNLLSNKICAIDSSMANCDIYSNVELGSNTTQSDPTNVTDAYFFIKQILYFISIGILILFSIGSELKKQYREIAIYRLLGQSNKQIVQKYIRHLFELFIITWFISSLIVIIAQMKLLLIPDLRPMLLTILLIPILIIIAVTIFTSLLLRHHLEHTYVNSLLERSKYD